MSKPQRYRFLDLYRGLIVLFMLEGHVLRALLTPELQQESWFIQHELLHGLTGPGFLFGAGFAFAIATQRRWDHLIAWTPAFLRRIWRVVLIIFIGYALHLPYLSLRKTFTQSTPQQWDALFAFDVLQCIGLTLLGLRLLLVILRNEKVFVWSVIILGLAIVYATPPVWEPRFVVSLPRVMAQAVNGLGASPFPIFPFSGFLLSGTVVAWLFLRRAQEGTEDRFTRNLAIFGVSLVGFGYGIDVLPFQTYGNYNFWFTSPNYFWIRLGYLLLLLSGLWLLESLVRHREDHDIWMPKWLINLGIESFAVYIAHLILLYGWVTNPLDNMTSWWGLKLTLWQSTFAFILFTIVMVGISQLWHFVKKRHPVLMQGVYWYLGGMVVYQFLVNPY